MPILDNRTLCCSFVPWRDPLPGTSGRVVPVLADHLQLVRNAGATRRGYFLRAETMHGFFTYLENNPSTAGPDIRFHDMSHGESFLELAVDRFRGGGLWVLDEPESALSFAGCLASSRS